jgi:hypothetical protein
MSGKNPGILVKCPLKAKPESMLIDHDNFTSAGGFVQGVTAGNQGMFHLHAPV